MALVGVLLAVVTGLVTAQLASLPTTQGRIGFFAALGTVLSILGLLISLGGFTLTLQQLSLARSAIEAASAEAARIRLSLKTYDATQDATRAEFALKEAKRHFDDGNFKAAATSYTSCASSLVMICNNVDDLSEEVQAAIQQADKYIESICAKIDRGVVAFDYKQKSEMRSHDRLIRMIQTHLQRRSI